MGWMFNECLFYCPWMQIFVIYYFTYFLIFIYLAASGLRCIMQIFHHSMQTLHLWPTGSLVVTHGLSCPIACRTSVL